MSIIHAIYENGVFRPLDPVALPEHSKVTLDPQVIEVEPVSDDLQAIYEVLSHRYDFGEADVAARHNEHQP